MKMKHALMPTLRDLPSEAVIPSHQLLLKGGFIFKTAAGMYNYLPLGKRVLAKVEKIVREEMDRFDGQEILMPITQPAELWEESGRWDAYGDEMMRLKDRHGRDFCLGPTHEEMMTDLVRQTVESYKSLPLRLYQIQNKYRDERRPRFGLMRGREFVMKDLYSFDIDEEGLDACYNDMYQAYSNVFDRCGLTYRAVLADSGQIGGGYTHEFTALAENGEGTIVYCEDCDYAANTEIAECVAFDVPESEKAPCPAIERISTPNIKTIDELSEFLDVPTQRCIKTLMYVADDQLIAVLTLGNQTANDIKVQKIHPCDQLELASDDHIIEHIGAHPGSLGPVGMPSNIPIYADLALRERTNLIAGANEDDYHIGNIDLARDAEVVGYFDLRNIEEGDPCPICGGKLQFIRGIEVGQIFKLGTKYSEAMNATVLDENGKKRELVMGCYGIGVSRTIAAAVEQYHDDKGIIWPKNIAPFQVHIVPVNMKNEEQAEMAERLYNELIEAGFEVLLDDRKERAGVKFNDADLIGIPVRLTIGKKSAETNEIEWKERNQEDSVMVPYDNLVDRLRMYYAE